MAELSFDTYCSSDSTKPLKSALDLSQLTTQNGAEFELDDENISLDDNTRTVPDSGSFDKNQLSANICLISDDEEDDNDEQSEYLTEMERLTQRMKGLKNSDVTPINDGGVLKQVKKQGVGKRVPEGALVFLHYNAYTEIGQPPYDSTRLRGEPLKLRLGQGNSIEGLELAVLSMTKNELSRFLIHYEYGYGEMGCPPRIPKKANLIFDVEVLNFTEQEGVDNYYDLTPEERRSKLKYSDIEKVVNVETAEAKQYFDTKNYQKAAYKYSRAQSILEEYHLKNIEEENLWTKQLLKVYMNSALCQHNLKHFGRTIHFCNEVLKRNPKSVKAFYFKGRALHGIGNFPEARDCLKFARNLDPSNTAISKALENLSKSIKEQEVFEKTMYQKMFSKPTSNPDEGKKNNSDNKQDHDTCSEEFRALVEEKMIKFKDDPDMTEMPFPSIQLTPGEIACILETANKLGMDYKERGTGSNLRYEVHKKNVKTEGSK